MLGLLQEMIDGGDVESELSEMLGFELADLDLDDAASSKFAPSWGKISAVA